MTFRLQEIKNRYTPNLSLANLSKLNYNGGGPGTIQPRYMANNMPKNNSIDSKIRNDSALKVCLPLLRLNNK